MNDKLDSVERVIGFDSHPDSFTAALLRGPTPASAVGIYQARERLGNLLKRN